VSPRIITNASTVDADVIIVGAGPAGSATAAYLAMAGLDVLLLEKAAFPREKVCGDGLTPRAVRELITLGIPTPAEDGWIKNHGLRIVGGASRHTAWCAPGKTSTTSWPSTRSSTARVFSSQPT